MIWSIAAHNARCDDVSLVSTFSFVCLFCECLSSAFCRVVWINGKSSSKSFNDNTSSIFFIGFRGISILFTFSAIRLADNNIWSLIVGRKGESFKFGVFFSLSGGLAFILSINADSEEYSSDVRWFSFNWTCFCTRFTSLSFKYLRIEQRIPIFASWNFEFSPKRTVVLVQRWIE